jgi:hypothetical protein
VAESGKSFRLPLESLEPFLAFSEICRQDLERDLPAEPRVLGSVDLAHSAFAQLGTDLEVGQSRADQPRAHPASDAPLPGPGKPPVALFCQRCRRSPSPSGLQSPNDMISSPATGPRTATWKWAGACGVEGTNGPAAFSSDGRWLAYVSDETGRSEFCFTSFPRPTERRQVSERGDVAVWWPRRGTDILFQDVDGMIQAVQVRQSEGKVELGLAKPLFGALPPRKSVPVSLTVDSEDERFLVLVEPRSTTPLLHVILDWPALIESGEEG